MEDILEHKTLFECLTCGHEWTKIVLEEPEETPTEVKDAYGNVLQDCDIVAMIKDKKLKGTSEVLKCGTKSKPIRIHDGGDHQISCKMNGISIMLKSQFVKKVQ